MSEESERLFRAGWALVLIGAASGLAFALLQRFVLGGLWLVGMSARGFGLIAGAISLALGCTVARIAERVAGCCGEVLLFPVLLCGLAAVVTGIGLNDLLGEARGGGGARIVFLAAGFWAVASVMVVADRLRN